MAPLLTNVIRLDSLPLMKAQMTPEGYLTDRPILTTTGIFEYHNPDGSVRRELRLPEDVFDPESLKSYKGRPIIITHDAGLIDKDNVKKNAIGTILSEGYRSGNDVRAEIIIHDTDRMKDCGLKELSLGYNLDLDETPGVWNGQPYDAVQKNIRINHLALVAEARAGEQARLNIDGRDKSIPKGDQNMKKTRKNYRHGDAQLSPEELAKAIAAYKAKYAKRDGDDEEGNAKPVASAKPFAGTAGDGEEPDLEAVATDDEDLTEEEKVQMVKDRKDRRDAEGKPENTSEAIEVITDQDDDIKTLLDIIDSLLAERDFGNAKKDGKGRKCDGDEEEEPVTAEDDDDEPDTLADGEDDTELDEDDDELAAEDEDDELTEGAENVAEDDDDSNAVPDKTDCGGTKDKKLNADSIDRIVRERIQVGMIGRKLHMDGLENMRIMSAKKAIIKAVRPNLRLDGKTTAYINAAYDCAVTDINGQKSTTRQKRQMFNKDSAARVRTARGSEAEAARQRMIDRQMNKNKEVK